MSTNDIDALLRGELNAQGYGFQHAVVQEIHRHRESLIEAIATEFPVSYRDRSTHIDVLAWVRQRKGLLIGECKRVNPKFGYWAFAKSPFTFDRRSRETWLERLMPANQEFPVDRTVPVPIAVDPYHVAYEVKDRKEDGDKAGAPKGRALSDALAQVVVGVNGMLHMLSLQKTLLKTAGPLLMIPAIFTTADLYATDDSDLHLAELKTGNTPGATFKKVPWLFYEHNVSPDLLAEIQREGYGAAVRFKDLLPARHTLAIAIVSHDGVSSFLRAATNLVFQTLD